MKTGKQHKELKVNTLHEIGAEGLGEAVKLARRWNHWHITLDTFARACGMPEDSRRRLELDRPDLWRLGFLELRLRRHVDELFNDWRTHRENSEVTHWLSLVGVGEYFVVVPNQQKDSWAVLQYDRAAGLERKVMFDAANYCGTEMPAQNCFARVGGALRLAGGEDERACIQYHGNEPAMGGRYLWCQHEGESD